MRKGIITNRKTFKLGNYKEKIRVAETVAAINLKFKTVKMVTKSMVERQIKGIES